VLEQNCVVIGKLGKEGCLAMLESVRASTCVLNVCAGSEDKRLL